MRNVYFVRHGETDLNRQHVVQGHIDARLNDAGHAQARALAEFVKAKGLKGDALLSSPLLRAVETAEPLARAMNLDIATDARLKEMFFGDCDGMSVKDLRALAFDPPLTFSGPGGESFLVPTGEVLRNFHASMDPVYDNLAHPGGETKAEARDRTVAAVFDHLQEKTDVKDLWVVCHGAILRFVMGKFAPPGQIEGGVRNASVLHFTCDPSKRALLWRGLLHAPDGALGL